MRLIKFLKLMCLSSVAISTPVFSKTCLTIVNYSDAQVSINASDSAGKPIQDEETINMKWGHTYPGEKVELQDSNWSTKTKTLHISFHNPQGLGHMSLDYDFGAAHKGGMKNICGRTFVLLGKSAFYYLFEPKLTAK